MKHDGVCGLMKFSVRCEFNNRSLNTGDFNIFNVAQLSLTKIYNVSIRRRRSLSINKVIIHK